MKNTKSTDERNSNVEKNSDVFIPRTPYEREVARLHQEWLSLQRWKRVIEAANRK